MQSVAWLMKKPKGFKGGSDAYRFHVGLHVWDGFKYEKPCEPSKRDTLRVFILCWCRNVSPLCLLSCKWNLRFHDLKAVFLFTSEATSINCSVVPDLIWSDCVVSVITTKGCCWTSQLFLSHNACLDDVQSSQSPFVWISLPVAYWLVCCAVELWLNTFMNTAWTWAALGIVSTKTLFPSTALIKDAVIFL